MSDSDSTYWAHSSRILTSDSGSRVGWQPLAVHLEAVATLAGELAEFARPGDKRFATLAGLSGLLDDYGKYTQCFQQMLRTGRGHCQHSIHGALLSYFGASGENFKPNLTHVAAAIVGHHAGLPDFTGDGNSLASRLRDERYRKEAQELLKNATQDSAGLHRAIETELPQVRLTREQPEAARLDLYPRMLASCLVRSRLYTHSGYDSQHRSPAGEDRPRTTQRDDGQLAKQQQ
jgi:CRISPR-associated endonuclease/helicase Cas3